ncbi:MAG TPA: hypothetical protein EYQ64_15425, partial [Gemmatimonadetes bacterium]|nr:hypothetical protein [Gemmatimonadota bacterium]
MRLLLIHDGFDLYGASRSFLRLATRLKVDGHEVLTVLLMEGPLAGALREQEIAVVINRRMATVMRRKTGRVSDMRRPRSSRRRRARCKRAPPPTAPASPPRSSPSGRPG